MINAPGIYNVIAISDPNNRHNVEHTATNEAAAIQLAVELAKSNFGSRVYPPQSLAATCYMLIKPEYVGGPVLAEWVGRVCSYNESGDGSDIAPVA